MKGYFISDNKDSFIGLSIAGFKGVIVDNAEDAIKVIDSLLLNKDIGIIILTEKITELIPERINRIKLSKEFPLIVEIPDRNGSYKGEDSIMRYVKDSIGLKI